MSPTSDFSIAHADATEDIGAVAALFRAYASTLSVDLAYQDFEAELAGLPGKYSPPGGALLIARSASGKAIGCVAMRPLDDPQACEMKRLFVAHDGRGLGLGRALLDCVLEAARVAGYREIRLDTLPDMKDAQALYLKNGFEIMSPYYETPIAGTIFMRRVLA